jgi:arylsulfatase A-like enzyme
MINLISTSCPVAHFNIGRSYVKVFLFLIMISPVQFSTAQSGVATSAHPSPGNSAAARPNIIFILTDDMGYGDIGCYNGKYATPNIDRMAAAGSKFTRYYSAAPVCSPSRVGFITGMAPAKWKITNYLSDRKHNKDCEQSDYLDPGAPSIARAFHDAGYATGHFGKWHMGGGRDVRNAPSIALYGFDEWASTWESPDPDPLLTSTNWIWAMADSIKRWDRTAYFIDRTLAFLKKNTGKPCFINLWPDDVHTPWVPGDDFVKQEGDQEKNFVRVLKEYDLQIGRLLDSLKSSGLDKNTIVIFTSDNGPAPNFRHDRSAGLRGAKLSLFEAGIKMPFIAWGATIPAGKTDSVSVITATDLFPTLCKMAKINFAGKSDGEDRAFAITGRSSARKQDIFWEYGRNEMGFDYPKHPGDRSPSLAILSGHWKLLINPDGSDAQLYDILADKNETRNIADEEKTIVNQLSKKVFKWWNEVNQKKR